MSTQNIENPITFEDWKAVISIKVHSKGKGRFTDKMIQNIATINEDINLLKKHGITSKNYTNKSKGYFKFIKKAFDEFGIQLSYLYPFKHPSRLYLEIHRILLDAGLNKEQIKMFYEISGIRKNQPTEARINKIIKKQGIFHKVDKSSLNNEIENERIEKEWDSLSSEKQRIIIGISDEEQERYEELKKIDYENFLETQKQKELFKRIKKKKK